MAMSSVSVTHSTFVGRESELQDLKRLLQEALMGKGQFVALAREKLALLPEKARKDMEEVFQRF